MKQNHKSKASGFTLIELLIVIAIVAILAVLSLVGARKFMEKGRKVQAMAQFRDFGTGLAMFITDYSRPPTPASKRGNGLDIIYGDAGGQNSTQFLISALVGEDKSYTYGGDNFSSKEANPRGESYIVFPAAAQGNKGGVGKDGKLYDPWGNEVMVGINGFKSSNPNDVLVSFNNGQNDERMYTWGLAEYKETKPKDQPYVFWSYGLDKKIGINGKNTYTSSDDVISW